MSIINVNKNYTNIKKNGTVWQLIDNTLTNAMENIIIRNNDNVMLGTTGKTQSWKFKRFCKIVLYELICRLCSEKASKEPACKFKAAAFKIDHKWICMWITDASYLHRRFCKVVVDKKIHYLNLFFRSFGEIEGDCVQSGLSQGKHGQGNHSQDGHIC